MVGVAAPKAIVGLEAVIVSAAGITVTEPPR
jgi:hypothetical protein